MSASAEGGGRHPSQAEAGGGEGQDKQADDKNGLAPYRYDPLIDENRSRTGTPVEHRQPAATEDATSNSTDPPTTSTAGTSGLDFLTQAAAIAARTHTEPQAQDQDRATDSVATTPDKGKQPESPADGANPGSVNSVWSRLYRTPRNPSSAPAGVSPFGVGESPQVVVGVHESPGPISRSIIPVIPSDEGGMQQSFVTGVQQALSNVRSQQPPPGLGGQQPSSTLGIHQASSLVAGRQTNRQQSSVLGQSSIASQPPPATYSQSSGFAAGRLLAYLNPAIVAGATPNTSSNQTSSILRGYDGNNTAVAGPSGTSTKVANRRPSTPDQPTTPKAPTPSPLTPPGGYVPTITVTSAPLPDTNSLNANDPNGALSRRLGIYQSFDTASDFLDRNNRPANERLIAPAIHDTYIIKTVSTVKCDECNSKLASGELYQCKTCSAQICQQCVNDRLKQEEDVKSFNRKLKQVRFDAVGGHHIDMEPEEEEPGDQNIIEHDVRDDAAAETEMTGNVEAKKNAAGGVEYKFDWQGSKKHLPFKLCYLDRGRFTGRDKGPFKTDVRVEDYAGVMRNVTVRIVKDTPRKSGGGKDGNQRIASGSGSGKGKSKGGKGRKLCDDADSDEIDTPAGAARTGKKKPGPKPKPKAKAAGKKGKAKGKGKEKEPQGTEDEPIEVDEWDEDSAQAQVQSAVLGGRPAFDKLRRMQEAARLGRTIEPQPARDRGGFQQQPFPPPSYARQVYPGLGDMEDPDDAAARELVQWQLQQTAQRQSQVYGGQPQQGYGRPFDEPQQGQQGYGRPFDQPQYGQQYVPTVHGHPDPAGFGSAAAYGHGTGNQAHPQQRHPAHNMTPKGRYQRYQDRSQAQGYPTPSGSGGQVNYWQPNPLYHGNPVTPSRHTANQFPTPDNTTREARRHMLGNEAATQTLPPGYISYAPLPAAFPNPHLHPGVHLGDLRDIPFGRGNTFVEQAPLPDGTPVSIELPQPYYANVLAWVEDYNMTIVFNPDWLCFQDLLERNKGNIRATYTEKQQPGFVVPPLYYDMARRNLAAAEEYAQELWGQRYTNTDDPDRQALRYEAAARLGVPGSQVQEARNHLIRTRGLIERLGERPDQFNYPRPDDVQIRANALSRLAGRRINNSAYYVQLAQGARQRARGATQQPETIVIDSDDDDGDAQQRVTRPTPRYGPEFPAAVASTEFVAPQTQAATSAGQPATYTTPAATEITAEALRSQPQHLTTRNAATPHGTAATAIGSHAATRAITDRVPATQADNYLFIPGTNDPMPQYRGPDPEYAHELDEEPSNVVRKRKRRSESPNPSRDWIDWNLGVSRGFRGHPSRSQNPNTTSAQYLQQPTALPAPRQRPVPTSAFADINAAREQYPQADLPAPRNRNTTTARGHQAPTVRDAGPDSDGDRPGTISPREVSRAPASRPAAIDLDEEHEVEESEPMNVVRHARGSAHRRGGARRREARSRSPRPATPQYRARTPPAAPVGPNTDYQPNGAASGRELTYLHNFTGPPAASSPSGIATRVIYVGGNLLVPAPPGVVNVLTDSGVPRDFSAAGEGRYTTRAGGVAAGEGVDFQALNILAAAAAAVAEESSSEEQGEGEGVGVESEGEEEEGSGADAGLGLVPARQRPLRSGKEF